MDVSWKREKNNNGTNGSGFNLVAVLVGNRHSKSSAKTNFTKKLGAIGEKFLYSKARDMRAFHQGLFWQHVDKKLNHLSIEPEEKEKIEFIISKTVPRPGDDWALWSVTCIPRTDR